MERTRRAPEEDDAPRSVSSLLDRLEQGLKIDEHALDEALTEQPQLFYNVAKELALAISKRDAAKQNVKLVEAEADAAFRSGAAQSGDKITETAVANAVRADKGVIAAGADLIKYDERVALLSALRDAFTQRSYALKDLVSLHLAAYYSQSSDVRAGHDQADMRARQVREQNNRARRGRDD